VYVAAFAPDAGESVNSLIASPPPGAPVPPILPPRNGFLLLDRNQVPRLIRRGSAGPAGRFHRRLARPVGRRRPQRVSQSAGLARQAELVPGDNSGPDDSPQAQRAMWVFRRRLPAWRS
jgi:hypothetical protein